MAIFNEETRIQLIDLIGELPEKVNIILFTKEENCRTCKDTQQYMTEFAELNDNLNLTVYNFDNESEKVNELNIERVPAIVILDKENTNRGVKFYGIPAGYEIHSLMASVKEAAGVIKDTGDDIEQRISNIKKRINIKVFVTPQCPHCPGAVITGHKIAFQNKNVVCEMIESSAFPDQAKKYEVRGVPKIVINETHEFTGNQPMSKFLEVIEGV